MSVRIIPAQMTVPAAGNHSPEKGMGRRTRVAAYCRVSTDLEEQESSFDAQVRHYTDYILTNPAWKLAGIYADEGLSGTGTKKRERFNAMIRACEEGEVDLVITKSISRFARNTLDCLKYIRKLKDLNIPILFEKEGIHTMDASGEMLITILASLAQQESQSISQNVRMGHQYRMQQGKPMVTTWFMGYRMSKDKSRLVIMPEQAVVVRRIFREFLEGMSPSWIAKGLMADGIKSPSGKEKWQVSTITSMLRNEKYMGDLLLQKWYIKDFINHKAVKNNGRFPQYYVQDAHPPVVPKEVFMQIKGEFLRREHARAVTGKNTIHSAIPFYEKIVCGECGNTCRRFNGGTPKADWRCKTRILKGTPCIGRIVKEKAVEEAVALAFQKLPGLQDELEAEKQKFKSNETVQGLKAQITALAEAEDAIRDRVSLFAESGELDGDVPGERAENTESGITAELERRKAQLGQMKAQLADLRKQKDELLRQKAEFDFKACQIDALLGLIDEMEGREQIHKAGTREISTETDKERYGSYWPEIERQLRTYPDECREISDFYERTAVHRHRGRITDFSNDDVQRYVEKIVVNRENMEVVFKAGVSVTIDR